MSTVFVNSGAGGANNGTSWTDAYTSLASTNGAAAGDIIKVHKTHSQTGLGSAINWSNGTVASPVEIICVDKDASDALSTGASVEWTTTALGPQGNIRAYGMTWKQTGAVLRLTPGADGVQEHYNCTLAPTGTTGVDFAGTRPTVIFKDVSVDLSGCSNAACGLNYASLTRFEWTGGTYTCRATQTNLFPVASVNGTSGGDVITGVNFSGTVTNLIDGSTASNGFLWLKNCTLPTYTNITNGAGNGQAWGILLDGCVAGTITVPGVAPSVRRTREGTVGASLTKYRTSGADDGSQANAYSWEMIAGTNAGAPLAALATPAITRWVSSGSQALKVYVASGVTLKDNEFWIEVLSPSEAGSATAQSKYRTTRAAPLATAANLTSDGSSTWNGTGVGTKQYATVTIAPTIAGPVIVRAFLAKASTTVYVDPVIEVAADVNGKSRFMEGAMQFAATSVGGGSVIVIDGD